MILTTTCAPSVHSLICVMAPIDNTCAPCVRLICVMAWHVRAVCSACGSTATACTPSGPPPAVTRSEFSFALRCFGWTQPAAHWQTCFDSDVATARSSLAAPVSSSEASCDRLALCP
jgi:hypothetical protein